MTLRYLLLISCFFYYVTSNGQLPERAFVISTVEPYVLAEARWAMQQQPLSITSKTSPRSAGSKHDFFSEGDYWWPDSTNPQGPYVQRDGMTNPDNFVAHRQLMIRLSRVAGALASAYLITHNDTYVKHAFRHLNAWFVDPNTRMNPSLLYAQAIKGRATGRGIGIIDTIHLMEVVQGVQAMEKSKQADKQMVATIRQWFSDYLTWLTTHPYGIDEMNAKNNHGTCWVMQVAAFARFTRNDSLMTVCRNRYRTVLLPDQMAKDGSFPLELRRTKPYGYSLFNLDAMATICQILSTPTDNLWTYQTPDGRSIQKGITYLYPYVVDKQKWPLKPDVMYWNDWPVAQPFLVFGALAYHQEDWLKTWQQASHDPKVEEVLRNLPIRNPLLWINET
ncbi:alginate lyase family protein [Spirosoma terrae]|uniref:Alginate lyase family protein n=1 Tax=Spirosoma terrae TaxID=1968276 RepID=A0A6L9L4T4_9BACT|nr:alginate lyase family protein [Spirosoma terrae]NDU94392.1 alginate lyase family protein [Spirosoma terrae]